MVLAPDPRLVGSDACLLKPAINDCSLVIGSVRLLFVRGTKKAESLDPLSLIVVAELRPGFDPLLSNPRFEAPSTGSAYLVELPPPRGIALL